MTDNPKRCASCHRDVDDPRRLDFMTDVLNRRWCSMCVEFGMSLVDPDAAWVLAGRGPVLEGARAPIKPGGIKMSYTITEITSEKLCAALGPAWVPRSTTDKVLAKAECAVGDDSIWVVVVPGDHGGGAVVLGLQRHLGSQNTPSLGKVTFSDRIVELVDANPGQDLGAAARRLLGVARGRLASALRVVDRGLSSAAGSSATTTTACAHCGGPGPFYTREQVLERSEGEYERDEVCVWCRSDVRVADRPTDHQELMRGPAVPPPAAKITR